MLMSPLRMFHSSGSSSRLVDRSFCPKGVRRSASLFSEPSGLRASVMERNLYMRNGLPCMPGRSWLKSTGVPRRVRTSRATVIRMGEKSSKPMAASSKSKLRLTAR